MRSLPALIAVLALALLVGCGADGPPERPDPRPSASAAPLLITPRA
jgi:predicted small lipoprotein YifL